jgi:hypothetical protein
MHSDTRTLTLFSLSLLSHPLIQGYFTVADLMRILLLRNEEEEERLCAEVLENMEYCSDDDSDDGGAHIYAMANIEDPYPGDLYEGLKPVYAKRTNGGGEQPKKVIAYEARWGTFSG